jgi:diguanylate cyclase (GGDEF)-like protein
MGQVLYSTVAIAALADAPLGVLILDQGGRVVWLNSALEKLLDIKSNRLLDRSAANADPAWRDLLFNPAPTLFLEATAGRPARWLQTWRMTPAGADGAVHYYADISDLQNALQDRDRLTEELAQHTVRDAVTGLPNRQALLQGLEPLVARSRRYLNPLSVIRLRIENLADIDAKYGSGNGAAALTAIAQMLKDQMRWADLVGRFDTDEFLLVLPETSADSASHLLAKLRQRLAGLAITSGDGRTVTVTTQFGLAGWQLGDDRAKLLRRARDQLDQHG